MNYDCLLEVAKYSVEIQCKFLFMNKSLRQYFIQNKQIVLNNAWNKNERFVKNEIYIDSLIAQISKKDTHIHKFQSSFINKQRDLLNTTQYKVYFKAIVLSMAKSKEEQDILRVIYLN